MQPPPTCCNRDARTRQATLKRSPERQRECEAGSSQQVHPRSCSLRTSGELPAAGSITSVFVEVLVTAVNKQRLSNRTTVTTQSNEFDVPFLAAKAFTWSMSRSTRRPKDAQSNLGSVPIDDWRSKLRPHLAGPPLNFDSRPWSVDTSQPFVPFSFQTHIRLSSNSKVKVTETLLRRMR